MANEILILCSTIDGHTRHICERLAKNVEATNNPATKALLARINKLR